jgi:predicted DNA-binding transcriptional regulator AlpA
LVTRKPWLVVGLSRTGWYRLMSQGTTPPPVAVAGARYWRVADLEAWVANLPHRDTYAQPHRRVPA